MRRFWTCLSVAVLLSLSACGGAEIESEELIGADETQTLSDALTSTVSPGAVLQTTAPLNLRTGPGTGYSIRLTMPQGARCTVVNTGRPQNGWYNVKYAGITGWAYGSYLRFYACPAGTYNLWNCNTGTGELVRCTNGLVERKPCANGCVVKPIGTDDVCKTVAVTPPPSTRTVLDYSWQGQQTGYYCGPGSTRIALSARMSSPPSQSTLGGLMGTDIYGTDHIGLVATALNRYLGADYRTRSISDPATPAQRDQLRVDVAADIRSGYALVANVVSGWRPPGYPSGTIYHYVAIVGYDSGTDQVLVADPAGACAAGSAWCNVPRAYWVSLSDMAFWIGGKGYAY